MDAPARARFRKNKKMERVPGKIFVLARQRKNGSAYSGCFAMYSCTEGQITSTFIRLVALLKARLIWTT
jgi:hypothetical protein